MPVVNHEKNGITHCMIDPDGKRGYHIGNPRGPQPVAPLEIYGVRVECLMDAGAEISLITDDCLQGIIKKARLSKESLNFHTPIYQVCRAANESRIYFSNAVTLPVRRGDQEIWIELQIPTTPLPRPLVLGTNGLIALGYKLLDTLTGKCLLTETQVHSDLPQNTGRVMVVRTKRNSLSLL